MQASFIKISIIDLGVYNMNIIFSALMDSLIAFIQK